MQRTASETLSDIHFAKCLRIFNFNGYKLLPFCEMIIYGPAFLQTARDTNISMWILRILFVSFGPNEKSTRSKLAIANKSARIKHRWKLLNWENNSAVLVCVYPLRRNFRKFYKPLSFTAVLRQLFKPLPRALRVSIFNPQDVKLNIHFMKAP